MDPVSHVAFGRTLVALDSRRILGPGAVAGCVIGSLAPDLDAVFMPIGWDIYLRRHQGGTHSLIGTVACAALTAAAVRLLSTRGRYKSIFLAAWAGALGHVLLDLISGADVRLFWPEGPVMTLPLFAMADPWLGGVLLAGLIALLAGRGHSGRTAAIILIAVTMLAGVKSALYARVSMPASDRSVQFTRAEARWGSLNRWTVYEATAYTARADVVEAVTRTVSPEMQLPRGLNDPLVSRSRQLSTVQNFLAAHGVTFATVIRGESPQVLWSDLRYCGVWRGGSAPWSPMALKTGLPLSCTAWFGVEFDSLGAPTASIVYIGHVVQRRQIR
jgi:membrane-bound metal-dependent hydrolase YbcI (DUF457 family)